MFSGGYRNVVNKLGGIQINTSLQGIPIPIVGGRNRISGNLLWYGDFIAKLVTGGKKGGGGGGSGKKGGGQYDYGAAVILGLCQGPIQRIGNIWSNTGYLPVNLTQEQFTVPPGGGTYEVQQINTFLQDFGCQEQTPYSVVSDDYGSPYGSITLTGTQLVPMSVGGGTGQYTESGGVYTFHAGDAGSVITINYTYAPPITQGGTAQDPITTIGFTTFLGAQGQAPWSYLTSNHPSQALGYSTVAYVATPRLDLGFSGTIPNFGFEIYGLDEFGNGNWECDPSVWCLDALTNPLWGGGFVSGDIGSMAAYSDYCVANGLFISPICDQQRTLADYLSDWLDGTNTEIVESGGKLNFIPRGDTTAVGNGQTFTPSSNPVYDLTNDDLIRDGSSPAVKVKRPSVQDAYNSVRIEYVDVGNNYNSSVVEAQDLGAIQQYKYRPEGIRTYHFFTQQTPAALAAQTLLARKVYIRNTYSFKLPARFFLLDPMDIVTLPGTSVYGSSGISVIPVRITSVQENADLTLNIEAEDFPWGCSGPTLYPKQSSNPAIPNMYAAPGSINPPVMFEALSRLNNQIGHNIWFGLSGDNVNWGGCNIHVSLDGTKYLKVGSAVSQVQMGYSTADFPNHADPDTSSTLAVNLSESFGELLSGTMLDADSGALLCYVGPPLGEGQTYFLLDSMSRTWEVTVDSGGTIHTALVSLGAVEPMILTDPTTLTSWQVGINDSGILYTTSVPFNSSYPALLAFPGTAYLLQVRDVSASGVLSTVNGGEGELISYETATLTAGYAYNIGANASPVVAGYIRRGFYDSTIGDHPAGSNFMLLNDAVEGWNYDVGLIGQTVYFKFTSFNQQGLVEEDISAVPAFPFTITGACIGLLTPAHSSYRPDSNPLTSFDAGASATIDVAGFNMIVPGQPNIAIGSGAITGLSYNMLYYIYFDDPGFVSGNYVFEATTDKETALSSAGRLFVGSITTPASGAPPTMGNNDGGAGAQLGAINYLSMATAISTGTSGNGTVTNLADAINGDLITAATAAVTGNGSANQAIVRVLGPPGIASRYSKATLYIYVEGLTNSLNGTWPPGSYSLIVTADESGGLVNVTVAGAQPPATVFSTVGLIGVTISNYGAGQLVAVELPLGINLSQVSAGIIVASGTTDSSGTASADLFAAWIAAEE